MTRVPSPIICDAPQGLRAINRNPRINVSSGLPVVAVANVRSLLPKMNSFIEKFENKEVEVCLISEVWEKQEKRN
jgi:glucosamine 6-phosphate synthetase-like amidotransferase/phosphosugar isomerase protein